MMYALGWVALFATTILLVESVQGSVKDKVDLRAILAALASGWAAISSGGVMAARGVQQRGGGRRVGQLIKFSRRSRRRSSSSACSSRPRGLASS
ncbi:MAG: hypothetical protein WKF75_08870 [Singulisphaera sp.]